MPADVHRDPGGALRSRDLADLAGTTPRALRHYHAVGLLPEPPRDANGYRRYSIQDLLRLLRIRQLAASGVPLTRIGEILDEDAPDTDALFDELDRGLAAEIDRLESQRRMLAGMRRATAQVGRLSGAGATGDLDRDVWTLLTASEQIDSSTASAILDALETGPLAQKAAAWSAEFEALERADSIDDEVADALAARIAEFAHEMISAIGVTPASEQSAFGSLAAQMQRARLSPAQHTVWERVAALTDGGVAPARPRR